MVRRVALVLVLLGALLGAPAARAEPITGPALHHLSTIPFAGYASSVDATETHAYVTRFDNAAGGRGGLEVVDLTGPQPRLVGSVALPGYPTRVVVRDGLAYVTERVGLQVVDVSDPANPRVVGATTFGGGSFGIALVGRYAYVAARYGGLVVIDVADPIRPVQVGAMAASNELWDVVVAGRYAYVADSSGSSRGRGQVEVVDLAVPTAPARAGVLARSARPFALALGDGHLYVAEVPTVSGLGNPDAPGGLGVLSLADPTRPVEVGAYRWSAGTFASDATDVVVVGSRAFVAGNAPTVHVVDVSDPARPTRLTAYHPGPNASSSGLDVVGDRVYLTGGGGGMETYRFSPAATLGTHGWRVQPTPRTADRTPVLYAVAAASPRVAWAAGSRAPANVDLTSLVLRTTDGGATWETAWSPGTCCEVVAIAAASETRLWALRGTPGGTEILFSDDAGTTWGTQRAGEAPLWAVAAASPTRVWAAGTDRILVSDDGGVSWSPRVVSTGNTFWAAAAASSSLGYAAGDGGVYRTEDGGQSWRTVRFGQYLGVAASGSSVWVVGPNNLIERSADGGATWSRGRPNVGVVADFSAVAAASETTAWVAAGIEGWPTHVLGTMDGGATWSLQYLASPTGDPRRRVVDVAAASPSSAWVVSTATVLGTATGGWNRVILPLGR